MTKKAFSPLTLRPVAASLATLLAVPLVTPTLAHAQGVELNTLKIEERSLDTNPYAEPGAPYKAKKSGDERYKRDLAETPKTISVLTKTQIEDSGYTDLRAILDAQPGITLGTGENGNAFGDRYIIRGQEARSDVFVDGIRDPGMTIRESFATEQVEITKGPDSSFGGRGTSGGAVNSVTKRANTVYDFSQVDVGLGMDKYRRLTLDTNQVLSDTTAVRINALHSYLENPDRSPTDAKRNGLALSGRFEISKDLEIDLDYYALRAKDLPDLGLFYAGASGARTIAWDAPVYAQTEDFLESEIDTITGKVRLQLGDSRYLTNVTRFGTTDNGYLMTGTRQTTVQAFNGVDVDDYNGTYLSTHQGWQEVEYLANSTQLHWPAQLGGQKHDFIFGLEYSDHKVKNGV